MFFAEAVAFRRLNGKANRDDKNGMKSKTQKRGSSGSERGMELVRQKKKKKKEKQQQQQQQQNELYSLMFSSLSSYFSLLWLLLGALCVRNYLLYLLLTYSYIANNFIKKLIIIIGRNQ